MLTQNCEHICKDSGPGLPGWQALSPPPLSPLHRRWIYASKGPGVLVSDVGSKGAAAEKAIDCLICHSSDYDFSKRKPFKDEQGRVVKAFADFPASEGAIGIGAEGYGEPDALPGQGTPVYIEFYGGKLRLHAWPDINNENATTIEMEGAKESARK